MSLLNRRQNSVHAQDSPSSEDSSVHIHMHALRKPATDLKQKSPAINLDSPSNVEKGNGHEDSRTGFEHQNELTLYFFC
jgi:hypothetical protein